MNNKNLLIITPIVLIMLISFKAYGQTDNAVSLIFTGDVMGHGKQLESALNPQTNKYEYDYCFKYIKNVFEDADFTIANLEVTLGGKPYKGYPQFSSPDTLAYSLKNAGVDMLVTANNHCMDRRYKGLVRTIDVLDNLNILHTGTFKNQEDRDKNAVVLLEKNNIKIAIVNYTYGTNGIKVKRPETVNLLDEKIISEDLEKAKKLNPDIIISVVHWGWEYQTKANKEQKKMAEFMFEHGANIIIGSHPHVLQPIVMENDKVVVYSLGNFISNQRTSPRDGGAIVKLIIEKNNSVTKVKDLAYMLTWVYKPKIEGRTLFTVLPVSAFENDKQFLNDKSFSLLNSYAKKARGIYKFNKGNVKEIVFDKNKPGWVMKF